MMSVVDMNDLSSLTKDGFAFCFVTKCNAHHIQMSIEYLWDEIPWWAYWYLTLK